MKNPFKKAGGGGFLNNVDVTVLGIELDTKFSGKTAKGNVFRKINGTLTVLPDGATEPVTTFVDFGFVYDEAITVDGAVINIPEGSDNPLQVTSRGKDGKDYPVEGPALVASFIEHGGTVLPEDDVDGLDFSWMAGLRVRTTKVVDEGRNSNKGKRKDKATGREYNHEQLRVSAVYERVDVKKVLKGVAKGATAAPATKKAGAAPKAAPATNTKVKEQADAAIVAMVDAAKDHTILKSGISGLFVKYCLKNNIGSDDREPIRNLLQSDEYLTQAAAEGLITFDPADKKGVIGATE